MNSNFSSTRKKLEIVYNIFQNHQTNKKKERMKASESNFISQQNSIIVTRWSSFPLIYISKKKRFFQTKWKTTYYID